MNITVQYISVRSVKQQEHVRGYIVNTRHLVKYYAVIGDI